MFTTYEFVNQRFGMMLEPGTIGLAQMMIEVYVGRMEEEITNARDLALLARATAFQAVFIYQHEDDSLFRTAIAKETRDEGHRSTEERSGESAVKKDEEKADKTTTEYDESFDRFIAPWAKQACSKLSWRRTRSVRTAPLYGQEPVIETTWRNE